MSPLNGDRTHGWGASRIAVLVNPAGSRFSAAGVGAVVFASFSWAAGSLYSRRAPLHSRPFVATGMEAGVVDIHERLDEMPAED